ncbi:TetR/AcrR family transcriptional regulator [Blastomonas sp.]|uniref:TetR/AcrR family transcriptional regulator n=1 Tax=Blastomonas sp. TaxID=1909299 RepID=UPI00263478BE|nr:TetR/AcrR family transcriptional regulator [Blastomonas sp.]MDM7956984.1 TetR/AcrR family transcriptional regulator [Blastomonas sp.]
MAPTSPSPRSSDDDGASPPTVLTRLEIYDLVWSQPMSNVAVSLGMSANGLAKICDRLLIPYPTRGYWAKVYAGKDQPQTALPPVTDDVPAEATITRNSQPSRRPRSRMSRDERSQQILDEAMNIARSEGVHAVSLKRVARDIGISEAQIYNYYKSSAEVLVAIARTELMEMNKARLAAARNCTDPKMRYTLTTIAYLRQVSQRGEIVQELLALPEVRLALRSDHQERRRVNKDVLGTAFEEAYGVPAWASTFVGALLTAMSLRGGRLMARGKADLETIERLIMPGIGAGIDYMIAEHGHRATASHKIDA